MPAIDAELLERLSKGDDPNDLEDWEDRTGHYVMNCRVTAEDVPQLIKLAWRWGEESKDPDHAPEEADYLPVTAWRALADLEAPAAVDELVEMLFTWDDPEDDWVSDDFPLVFGKIGEPAIEPLVDLFKDVDASGFVRDTAVRGLRQVAEYHADTRDRIISLLSDHLAHACASDIDCNTYALKELVELYAVESAETIERAFAADLLDVGAIGDWEVIRRDLGVEGLGLKMPEHPYNSMKEYQIRMGVGIFSKDPIFITPEPDQGAADAYFERAHATFSRSPEAQQVVERNGRLHWYNKLLSYGVICCYEIVDRMTADTHADFLRDAMRFTNWNLAEIIDELKLFWQYLKRVYRLPQAESILQWLAAEDLIDEVKQEAAFATQFDAAKSEVITMVENGRFDMSTDEGLADFLVEFTRPRNLGPPQNRPDLIPAAEPIRSEPKVGRNDPCPCGSGRKFKKCCL